MNSTFNSPQDAAERRLGAMMFHNGDPCPPAPLAARGWQEAQALASRPIRHAWHPPLNQAEADSRAAILDRPAPTGMADVWRMTAGPTLNALKKQCRALLAAAKAYKAVIS
jgi:hypothetical protein